MVNSTDIYKKQSVKLPNLFTVNDLSIHYPTNITNFNVVYYPIMYDEWLFLKDTLTVLSDISIKPTITDDTMEFKILYHPVYNNGKKMYGYKYLYANPYTIISTDYRFRSAISY